MRNIKVQLNNDSINFTRVTVCRVTTKEYKLNLKNKNPPVVFIPCADQSSNIVGQAAVSCGVEAASYFGFK